MTRQPAIVCFSCYDYWHSNPGSPLQIMLALHRRGHRVLWINSIGMNLPRLRQRRFVRRATFKIQSWARWLREPFPGFHVLSPLMLPLYGRTAVEALNDRWLTWQIRGVYRSLGIREPLAFVCLPSFAPAVAALPRRELVYYYADKYSAYRDIRAKEAIERRDRSLFDAADLVLCASRAIHEELAPRRPRVHYFSHAVEAEFLADPDPAAGEPSDLAGIPHPRIGYFGSLTDSNDLEMIRHAARADPALQFVMIGRVLSDYSALRALPNVHFLGFKPHQEIPAYGRHFDVGFMVWRMTDWIRHCNPVKTKEYLALGLPVVSVPIAEVEREHGGYVYFARDGEEFLASIRRALAEDSAEQRRRRIQSVRGDSWDAWVDRMMSLAAEVSRAS